MPKESYRTIGRILRTFKIKKNVEVTDNGKIIIKGIGRQIRATRGLLNLKIVYTYSLLIHCLQMPRRNQSIQKSNLHMKSIFEQLGGTYHEENGYLIPDIRLPAEEEQPIGIWG